MKRRERKQNMIERDLASLDATPKKCMPTPYCRLIGLVTLNFDP